VSPPTRWSSSERLCLALLLLTAIYYAVGVLWRQSAQGHTYYPAYDFYALFYPNLVYAWRSLREGSGLLWNPYQACGQPFFANSQVGLLYPTNILFLLLERENALIANIVVHLSIAGGGVLLLGRSLGLGVPAALCAALAFQLNWATLFLATAPIHMNSFAWLPVAMWRAERVVQQPRIGSAVALGLVLTLQILPGFYQIGFYTYQIIALRIVWAMVTRQTTHPLRVLSVTSVGLLLPLFLAAIQLVPSIELARASIRTIALNAFDFGKAFTWRHLPARLMTDVTYPGSLVTLVFASLALIAPRRHRPWGVAFFAMVAAVYFILGLGPGTVLYDLYEQLPFGKAFRVASRLRWITSFAMAMLVGLAAESTLRCSATLATRWLRVRTGVLLAAALSCFMLPTAGLRATDGALLILLAAGTVAVRWRRSLAGAAVVLPLVVFINCAMLGTPPFFGLVWGNVYGTHADVLAAVRERMTAQDRILTVGDYPGLDLTPKSATLWRLPSTYDYEAQTPLHYADVFTFMRTGQPLQQLSDWHWLFGTKYWDRCAGRCST
jgi:hypothetical protein